MRKIAITLLFCLTVIVYNSCIKAKKNVRDYYPVVNTKSATINEDGDVVMEAEITSTGDQPLEYYGFCVDTVPVPSMMTSQIRAENLNGTNYSSTYPNTSTVHSYNSFEPSKTYYFRSWATNGNGYSYGNTISLSNITSVTPCTLTLNTLNGSPITFAGTPNNISGNKWQVTAYNTPNGNLYFTFGSALRNKVFTTVNSSNPNSNSVYIQLGSITLNSGSKVYVKEISPNKYDIAICSASYPNGTISTYYLNARFVCPS